MDEEVDGEYLHFLGQNIMRIWFDDHEKQKDNEGYFRLSVKEDMHHECYHKKDHISSPDQRKMDRFYRNGVVPEKEEDTDWKDVNPKKKNRCVFFGFEQQKSSESS